MKNKVATTKNNLIFFNCNTLSLSSFQFISIRAVDKNTLNFTIFFKAYKGLLKNVFLQSSGNRKADKTQTTGKPVDQSGDSAAELPEIAGVTFENREGVIVANGEKLFDKRQQLKAAGFAWNKSEKVLRKMGQIYFTGCRLVNYLCLAGRSDFIPPFIKYLYSSCRENIYT